MSAVGSGNAFAMSDIEGTVVVMVVMIVASIQSIIESVVVAVIIAVMISGIVGIVIPSVMIPWTAITPTPSESVMIVSVIIIVWTIVARRPPPAVTEVDAHAPDGRVVAVPVLVGEIGVVVSPAVIYTSVETTDTGSVVIVVIVVLIIVIVVGDVRVAISIRFIIVFFIGIGFAIVRISVFIIDIGGVLFGIAVFGFLCVCIIRFLLGCGRGISYHFILGISG